MGRAESDKRRKGGIQFPSLNFPLSLAAIQALAQPSVAAPPLAHISTPTTLVQLMADGSWFQLFCSGGIVACVSQTLSPRRPSSQTASTYCSSRPPLALLPSPSCAPPIFTHRLHVLFLLAYTSQPSHYLPVGRVEEPRSYPTDDRFTETTEASSRLQHPFRTWRLDGNGEGRISGEHRGWYDSVDR